MSTKKYVVTLKKYDDLDNFYTEMEASSGNATVPTRVCNCTEKRDISRNTNYELTDEEAVELRKDSRVLAVELEPSTLGIFPELNASGPYQNESKTYTRFWNQTDQASTWNNTHKNWGIARHLDGSNIPPDWGMFNASGIENQTKITNTTSSGKNVDIVIMDHFINSDHPEFAINADGSGGSRVNQINWFGSDYASMMSANNMVTSDTYSYGSQSYTVNGTTWSEGSAGSNHGNHVASLAAGNTHGWARDANIYNITFHTALLKRNHGNSAIGGSVPDFSYDCIRHWHNNIKTVNPATGRKNPTIINMSWGNTNRMRLSQVTGMDGRTGFSDMAGRSDFEKKAILEAEGIFCYYAYSAVDNDNVWWCEMGYYTYFLAGPIADLEDMFEEGIIVVSAAGNYSTRGTIQNEIDYNTKVYGKPDWALSIPGYDEWWAMRGSIPQNLRTTTGDVIAVGSVSPDEAEYRDNFSTYSKAVDIWAVGNGTVGAYYDDRGDGGSNNNGNGVNARIKQDPRSSGFFIGPMTGTSMASPQVAGVIACLLEQEPNLKQSDVLQHLIENATNNVGNDGDITNYALRKKGLLDSHNRMLKYVKKRPETGTVYPHPNHSNRRPDIHSTSVTGRKYHSNGGSFTSGATGVKWPRTRQVVTKPI